MRSDYQLVVLWDGESVGHITPARNGGVKFSYIEPVHHRALQAGTLLVNRFSDIARIPAKRTAIHRLQIILGQSAGIKRRAQLRIDCLHLLLHAA